MKTIHDLVNALQAVLDQVEIDDCDDDVAPPPPRRTRAGWWVAAVERDMKDSLVYTTLRSFIGGTVGISDDGVFHDASDQIQSVTGNANVIIWADGAQGDRKPIVL